VARPKRIFVPDGIYHVVSRGSNREPLYRCDGDRVAFTDRLTAVVADYDVECLALTQMTNHYHLVVRTPDARLSDALRDLHGGYSRATVGREPPPDYLALETLLGLLGADPAREQERYRLFVEAEVAAARLKRLGALAT
jgi:REP element-mobilizing transposase RayT